MIKGLEGDADRETAGGPLLGTLLLKNRRSASGKKETLQSKYIYYYYYVHIRT